MAKLLTKMKGKDIKDKDLKWFRSALREIAEGKIPVNNIRAVYKGKSNWIKVSFWCEVKRVDKEEKKNGGSKAKRPNN